MSNPTSKTVGTQAPGNCPFCGSPDTAQGWEYQTRVYIFCRRCGARGPWVMGDDIGAISSWNTRSPDETPAPRPIDCKHERADIRCPDCGIDFRGASYTDTASRRDAVRYRWLRDWYHREGKRAEIDPDGHVAVRTLPEWEALLDAAIARSSSVEPTPPQGLKSIGFEPRGSQIALVMCFDSIENAQAARAKASDWIVRAPEKASGESRAEFERDRGFVRRCPKCGEELGPDGHHKHDEVPELL